MEEMKKSIIGVQSADAHDEVDGGNHQDDCITAEKLMQLVDVVCKANAKMGSTVYDVDFAYSFLHDDGRTIAFVHSRFLNKIRSSFKASSSIGIRTEAWTSCRIETNSFCDIIIRKIVEESNA